MSSSKLELIVNFGLDRCVIYFSCFDVFANRIPSRFMNRFFFLEMYAISYAHSSFRKLLEDLRDDIHKINSDPCPAISDLLDNIAESVATSYARDSKFSWEDAQIPAYLEERFEIALRAANPELQTDERFPLARGINAFHHHLKRGSSMFQPKHMPMERDISLEQETHFARYLELMKSIWIIRKVGRSDEYKEISSDRLWNFYMSELRVVSRSSIPNTTLEIIEYIHHFRRNV